MRKRQAEIKERKEQENTLNKLINAPAIEIKVIQEALINKSVI
jgi:hypothetical protein